MQNRAFKVIFYFIVLKLIVHLAWGGQGASKLVRTPDPQKVDQSFLNKTHEFFKLIQCSDTKKVKTQLETGDIHVNDCIELSSSVFQKYFPSSQSFLKTMHHAQNLKCSPLFLAICCKRHEIVELFLERKVNVANVVEIIKFQESYILNYLTHDIKKKYTALEVAALCGNVDIVKEIYAYTKSALANHAREISNSDLQCHNDPLKNIFILAFIYAIRSGNVDLVSWMLEQGANANHFCEGMFYNISKYVLNISALSVAVLLEHTDITWLLLEAGANPDEVPHKKCVDELNVSLAEYCYKTLQYEIKSGESKFLCACRTQNIIMMHKMIHMGKDIVRKEATINCENQCSIMNMAALKTLRAPFSEYIYFYPLFIAAKYGRVSTVKQLLMHGANAQQGIKIIASEDQIGVDIKKAERVYTPLAMAAFCAQENIVSVLLEKYDDDDQQVCLFAAAAAATAFKSNFSHVRIIQTLLAKVELSLKKRLYVVDPFMPDVRYNIYDMLEKKHHVHVGWLSKEKNE